MARILIIDDNPHILTALRKLLVYQGHTIIDVPNSGVGIAMHHKDPFDLIITDIVMPGKEGITTIIELKKEYPNLKIIDVGCASGLTGFRFVNKGHLVTFHDFEGIGLEFIRWFLKDRKYGNAHWVVPYGNSLPYGRYDAVVSIDVLEHTGNHLGYLKWLENEFFISFPYNKES